MSESKLVSGLKSGIALFEHQKNYVDKILSDLEKTNKINFFISLPQGAGKTTLALAILSELLNRGKVNHALILTPRRVLVDQWVEEAQKMFFGLKILKGSKLSKQNIGKTKTTFKHSKAKTMAMTIQSFRNHMKKGYFQEKDFDFVILDEASDSALAKDFLEKYRMSYYLEGLEKWNNIKLLVFPKDVDEVKLENMIKKFNEKLSELIREEPESLKQLEYVIRDSILIDDPVVNKIAEILDNEYKTIRRNVLNILKKLGIKGFQENLETLLKYSTMMRVKKTYGIDEENVNFIRNMIIKYIIIKHLRKWFLYSNREDLKRTLLASQFQVKEWLGQEDKKLQKLKDVIKELIGQDKKVYIFSEYISTAEMIFNYLLNNLKLKNEDIELITGRIEDQYTRLDNYRKNGKVLISTPVFDKGTDIPEVDSAIIFTPPRNMEKIHQIKGRIRGGEIIFLAYMGYEEEIIKQIIESLRG